jgi:metallo-beta-lactamase class B
MLRLTLFLLSFTAFGQFNAKWNIPTEPHKIATNLYYVGTNDLSCYLVTSPQGHILINMAYEESVPLVVDSIKKLGFKPTDVKILLISHAHDDHMGGIAAMQKATGAKVQIMDGDAPVVESGGKALFYYQDTMHWKPVKVDRVLHDRDEVKLGGNTLVAHLTPGHTKGCTTWTMKADGKDVLILGSVSINPGVHVTGMPRYPEIEQAYAQSFRVLKALSCDIFLASHASLYNMDEKLARAKKGDANAWVDPKLYREVIARYEGLYNKQVAEERASAKKH